MLFIDRSFNCCELYQCEMGNKGTGGHHDQQAARSHHDHHHWFLLHYQR